MNIFILDKNFNRIEIIDVYDSFIWTDRYCDSGDFELVVPANEKMLSILKKEYYLEINDSEYTMIIESIELKTDIEAGNELIITGRSLDSILDRRIVWKQTQLNGDFQNQIKKLINENAISPTDTNRRIPNLIFENSTDPAITSLTVDTQYTGDNLLAAIQNLCSKEHVGFKVTLNANKQMVFKLYAGADRSFDQTTNPAVEFSPKFDNLLNTDHVKSIKPYKNVTLVGGEGEGAERRFVTVGSSSGLDRREVFTDARSISSKVTDDEGNQTDLTDEEYAAKLTEKGDETLANNGPLETFNGEVNANVQFLYNRDYFLGDVVQIENEFGEQGTTRIIEVVRSDDAQNGLQTYPTFKSDAEDTQSSGSSSGTTTGGGSGSSYNSGTTLASRITQAESGITNLGNLLSGKISSLKSKSAVYRGTSNKWECTGLYITAPSGHLYLAFGSITWNSQRPLGVAFSSTSTSLPAMGMSTLNYESASDLANAGGNPYIGQSALILIPPGNTRYLWERRIGAATADNTVTIYYIDITL